jgi:hypothetical protein
VAVTAHAVLALALHSPVHSSTFRTVHLSSRADMWGCANVQMVGAEGTPAAEPSNSSSTRSFAAAARHLRLRSEPKKA